MVSESVVDCIGDDDADVDSVVDEDVEARFVV